LEKFYNNYYSSSFSKISFQNIYKSYIKLDDDDIIHMSISFLSREKFTNLFRKLIDDVKYCPYFKETSIELIISNSLLDLKT
jgi:hypothetical protein